MAGNTMELIDVSEAHIAAINAGGLRLVLDGVEHIIPVHAARADTVRAVPELLVLFTKAPHTETALTSVRHLIGPKTWALTLQNGLGNGERLSRHIAPERILIGMTNWPADLRGPGQVASHGSGEVRFWSYNGEPGEMIDRIACVLSEAGFKCTADPAVMSAIWEKVAFNAVMNAVAAITGYSVGEMADRWELRELATDIIAEIVSVARAAGITLQSARISQALEFAYAHHRTHLPSMLQDLRAGRATEIDSINGAVVREAERLGLAAPVNATLTRLVRALERTAATPSARTAAAPICS